MNNTNIFDVDQSDFENKVINASDKKLIIVDFWAPWCGPCKRSTPLVNELYSKMPDNVSMVIVDMDKGKDISSALRIRSIPTMYSFVNSAPMDSVIGGDSENITSFFKKTLARALS